MLSTALIRQNRLATTAADPYWTNVILLLNFEGGTATDVSNSKQTVTSYTQTAGTPVGAGVVETTTNPRFGSYSASFPDHASALSLPTQTFAATFTIDFWLYLTNISSSSNEQVFCVRNSSNAAFLLQMNTDGTLYYSLNNVYSAKSTIALVTGQWYHIAFVNNASAIKVYVNGTATNMTSSQTLNTLTTNFIVGGTSYQNGTGDRCIQGYMDDFRITNNVARFTTNFTPPNMAAPTHG